jgi:putative tricarboxylic transport membrane protein
MSLGLLSAGVGMDTASGQLRLTFGSNELLRGINFLVEVIGVFGTSDPADDGGAPGAPRPCRRHQPPRGAEGRVGSAKILAYAAALVLHRLLARNHAGGATAASSMGYNPAKRFSNERPGRGGVGQVPRSISALSTTTQRIVSFL